MSTAPGSTRVLRLGTRHSALATTQSAWVAERLRRSGHEVEIVEIVTEGDTSTASLASFGGTGVFAAALRRALLAGEVDLAVHSLKDLPTAPEPGLTVAAVPRREDPRDVLVSHTGATLGELPSGAVIGTGSPRRVAQLAALGLGLEFKDIRGNVDTRIALARDGGVDAVVLARAGLARLDRLDEVAETLDPLQVLPAPGQGALAVECREDDAATRSVLAALDDADTRLCVTAERALLSALEAGCSAPVGALAEVVEGEDGLELSLRGFVGTVDGSFDLRRSLVAPLRPGAGADGGPVVPAGAAGATGPTGGESTGATAHDLAAAQEAGRRLAAVLLEDGAGALDLPHQPLERPPAPPAPDPAVATGDDPLAAPDRSPDPTSTERAQ